MDVKSTYKNARISARKARDVAREIQGLPVSAAIDLLAFTPRKGARLFSKTVKTAVADAEHNFELSVDSLIVKSAVVGEGPTLKRFKPRARGSAGPIRKRTSHLTVILSNDSFDEQEERPSRTRTRVEKSTDVESAALDESTETVYDSTPDEVDDLKSIAGITAALEEKLNSLGVHRIEQIANWSDQNIDDFVTQLSLENRDEADAWVAQAKELSGNNEEA